MTTLLIAEGLISEEEQVESDAAADRFERSTGETPDIAAEREDGDFFRQAQSFIDRSLEGGLLSAEEAGHFRGIFERIKVRLGESHRTSAPEPTET